MGVWVLLSAVVAAGRAGAESPSAYSYLNVPASTRIYGLGGVNISTVSDDINLIDQNPSLLGPEFGNQLGLNYMRYIAGSNFAGVRFSLPSGEHGAWAVGVQYYGYGQMDMTEADGTVSGVFSPKDMNFSGTYSHDFTDRLRGGANLKLLYSAYGDYTAFAVATDLGVNYYNPDSDLSLSAVVANLGGQIKRFDNTYDRLPVDIRLGATKSFGALPVRFSVTAWNLTEWERPHASNPMKHLVFGADFEPSESFHIEVGYNYKTRADMSAYSRSSLSGFSLGAGLNVRSFGVGVALAQPHNGATTFMFNISTNLSELL